ncbi:helix-turn-helix domain-containing protein [Nitratidesulfovibrio liaohensis]|uniref:Helix-turn-helix domain-containing protein n=1 Tax=Nitratidesulfovibrio liaohensis TaxID=2604158 RepID=A0ABY9R5A9_9BACT|nr:helix-turn-helix domain-containing protein [Nitratidesulfovibrio liaohensis]WMW66921.1 helix-turn-helix domain-containing protein [Nitratidesulfovibrio liaohensis]
MVEAARSLGCTRQHVYDRISAGEIVAARLGLRNGLRVPEGEVDRFVDRRWVAME